MVAAVAVEMEKGRGLVGVGGDGVEVKEGWGLLGIE